MRRPPPLASPRYVYTSTGRSRRRSQSRSRPAAPASARAGGGQVEVRDEGVARLEGEKRDETPCVFFETSCMYALNLPAKGVLLTYPVDRRHDGNEVEHDRHSDQESELRARVRPSPGGPRCAPGSRLPPPPGKPKIQPKQLSEGGAQTDHQGPDQHRACCQCRKRGGETDGEDRRERSGERRFSGVGLLKAPEQERRRSTEIRMYVGLQQQHVCSYAPKFHAARA